MEEDIDFDNSVQLFPGVDLALWLTITVGLVICLILAAVAVWVA